MDRRQQKTRKAIFQGFLNLLEKKSYGNITVQEIIDEADIGRSTFYAHFETKDDLLREICEDIFGHVFSEELMKETTHDFSGKAGIDQKITHILYHLRLSRSYIRSLLACQNGELFMCYFKEYLSKVLENYLPEEGTDIPKSYMLNHLVCDFAETVRWWTCHEEYTPEEISHFFFATTTFIH